MLTVTRHRLTWMTQLNFCRSTPYKIVDLQEWRSGTRITFQLERVSASCHYPVLVLTYDRSDDTDIGWGVAGYPSLEAANKNARAEMLDCWLYRY